jgi:hypothetical protein
MQNQIKYLKHEQIDKKRWDECIENSSNGIIYTYSWYLDVVAPGWEALIAGDYEAVMPLPVRKKFGVRYVSTPYFTQQLGVFGNIEKNDVSEFILCIPSGYKFISLNLNEYNAYNGVVSRNNSNYKIDLKPDYGQISKTYNRNCIRNIKKAKEAGFEIHQSILPQEFSEFVDHNLSEQLSGVGKGAFRLLEKLIVTTIQKEKGELVCLKDSKGIAHAAGFYLFDKQRLIFSVCASTEFGKANQAMYLLVDSQIQKYAGKFEWYDFSGSNIKGIAYFNSTFGAEVQIYQTISLNRLPVWLRLLKR